MKIIVFLLLVLAWSARGCPLCHTRIGEDVRASVFGPDFSFNLIATVLPFAIFLGVTALIYFGAPFGKRRSGISSRLPAE